MEKYSNHPIAKSLTLAWKGQPEIRWNKITEIRGYGMQATSTKGDEYKAGSAAFIGDVPSDHTIWLKKNSQIAGWIDMQDEIRSEASEVIAFFKKRKIKTILLSGDLKQKCIEVAATLGMDEVMSEQTPQQKLQQLERLTRFVTNRYGWRRY